MFLQRSLILVVIALTILPAALAATLGQPEVAPASIPPGGGSSDPWVDARGDAMTGDLLMNNNNGIVFGGIPLYYKSGALRFNGSVICLENTTCRGPPGIQGIQGVQGVKGDPGVKGDTGAQGPPGSYVGTDGIKVSSGAIGIVDGGVGLSKIDGSGCVTEDVIKFGNGDGWHCWPDQDTPPTAGAGIAVDADRVVSIAPCETGDMLQASANGGWECVVPASVTAGEGLVMDGTTISLKPCPGSTMVLKSDGGGNTWACAPDEVGVYAAAYRQGLVLTTPGDVPEFGIQPCAEQGILRVNQGGWECSVDHGMDFQPVAGLAMSQDSSGNNLLYVSTIDRSQIGTSAINDEKIGYDAAIKFSKLEVGNGAAGTFLAGSGASPTWRAVTPADVGAGTFASAETFAQNVTASKDAIVKGFVRAGSELGTSQPPAISGATYQGVVTRRAGSTTTAAGSVVARTDKVTFERDGTNGGFRVSVAAVAGEQVVYCNAITSSGATLNVMKVIPNSSSASTAVVFANTDNVVSFHCNIGSPFNNGHTTTLDLFRSPTDFWWIGTLTSTFNQ